MGLYLGVDTSNYTTSAALYDSDSRRFLEKRRLLPVKPGEKGIRQSDAVFHHTQALPELLGLLFDEWGEHGPLTAAGASDRPVGAEGSYMPCFTVGTGFVSSLCYVSAVPAYFHSHQMGHIAAALFSAERLDLFQRDFIAFHVSGGTTEAVLCQPDRRQTAVCTRLVSSSDLKAGQAIDRVGVMLGYAFPAGGAVDALSLESRQTYRCHPSVKNGCPSLSGVQNQCETMFRNGDLPCDIAKYCLTFIGEAIGAMAQNLAEQYPGVPFVFSGGVMSNTLLRQRMSQFPGAVFAKPEFSRDNAVGTAVLAAIKDEWN